MARLSHLIPVFNVQCVMCGRAAGQLIGNAFIGPSHGRPPAVGRGGESRCGECGGNLYLEPDESITPFMAAQIAQQRAQQLEQRQQAEQLKAA